jgi:NTE family protein
MPDAQRKADLVLEGGGVKGIGLLGAVLVLADAGYSFPRVAGTSAGAIVASLVAAYQRRARTCGTSSG